MRVRSTSSGVPGGAGSDSPSPGRGILGRFIRAVLRPLGAGIAVEAWRYVRRPIPLEDFVDYDEYWDTRRAKRPDQFKTRFALGAQKIPAGSSVLDVGCGEGVFLEYLRMHDPTIQVLGVDTSARAVEVCQQKGLPAIVCDLTAGERPPGAFDVVTAFEVIEHIPDAERFLAALGDLCAGSGFLLVSLPNTGFIWHRLRLLCGRFPITSCHCHIKEHVRFWSVRDFCEWADAQGYEVQSVEGQRAPGNIGGNPLWLERRFPALWAPLVIYQLRRRA